MKIDDVYWHDGVLGEVRFAAKERGTDGFTLIMHASLYSTDTDSQRRSYRFSFAGSGLLSITCDFHELRENRGAGNISYGYCKKQANDKVFWLHLVDGHITFRFKSVRIEAIS